MTVFNIYSACEKKMRRHVRTVNFNTLTYVWLLLSLIFGQEREVMRNHIRV